MKIAYYAEWDIDTPSGVLTKIVSQIDQWIDLGIDAKLFIVSKTLSGLASLQKLPPNSCVETFDGSNRLLRKFSKYSAIRRTASRIKCFAPDALYFRATSWTPGIVEVLSSSPAYIVEINSLEANEYGQFRFDRRLFDYTLSQEILRRSDGIVCVTNELAAWAERFRKPQIVIANGYRGEIRSTAAKNNNRGQLVLSIGNASPWQGLDKYIRLASILPQYDFNIVGLDGPSPAENVIFHGRMDAPTISEFYGRIDVGFGTLALHRKGLEEACPLKVREYLAHGLPVVGAYFDTDITGHDFYLKLPNVEATLEDSCGDIVSFIERWRGRRVDDCLTRTLIGFESKERRRVSFLQTIATQAKGRKRPRSLHSGGPPAPI